MKDIAKFFNWVRIPKPESYVYRVVSLSNIIEKIIPFFQNNPIHGVKYQDFQDFG